LSVDGFAVAGLVWCGVWFVGWFAVAGFVVVVAGFVVCVAVAVWVPVAGVAVVAVGGCSECGWGGVGGGCCCVDRVECGGVDDDVGGAVGDGVGEWSVVGGGCWACDAVGGC
jgi:hypothetical protein